MNHRQWTSSWKAVLVAAAMASLGMAQSTPGTTGASGSGRGAFGFVSILEHKVGLTPEQRDSVRGLLADQRQKSQALREETDGKIRALLNAEQQKKFDEVLSEQKARYSRGKQRAS